MTDEGKRLHEFTQRLLEKIDSTLEDIHAENGGDRNQVIANRIRLVLEQVGGRVKVGAVLLNFKR